MMVNDFQTPKIRSSVVLSLHLVGFAKRRLEVLSVASELRVLYRKHHACDSVC